MARQFNGTNQSLQSASNIDLSAQSVITVAFWMWWDTFASDNDLAIEFTAQQELNKGFIVNPNQASGVFQIGLGGSGSEEWSDSCTRPSAAVWHQYIFQIDRATPANALWIDNSSQSLSTLSHIASSYTNFGNALLNVMCRNNASLFGAGRMAELAIYSGTLTAGQRASLQTSVPSVVGSPLFYWPIAGVASPEPSLAGGIDLTVNGATYALDPTIIPKGYPRIQSAGLSVTSESWP